MKIYCRVFPEKRRKSLFTSFGVNAIQFTIASHVYPLSSSIAKLLTEVLIFPVPPINSIFIKSILSYRASYYKFYN